MIVEYFEYLTCIRSFRERSDPKDISISSTHVDLCTYGGPVLSPMPTGLDGVLNPDELSVGLLTAPEGVSKVVFRVVELPVVLGKEAVRGVLGTNPSSLQHKN
jgi:hypothetical protein